VAVAPVAVAEPHAARAGLSSELASARLAEHGPNTLPELPAPTALRRLLHGMRDPLVLVLLVALALTLLTGDLTDAAVIALVVVVNAGIGLHQELQAERSVRALAGLVATHTWVVRSGLAVEVPVAAVVPGDLVRLRQGDLVPADGCLVEGSGVELDESALTGESLPVPKSAGPDPGPDPPAGSRTGRAAASAAGRSAAPGAASAADPGGVPESQRVLAGTVVLRGRGLARVTATGGHSSVGQIAALMVGAAAPTPLQRRMARLSAQLAVGAVLLSSLVLVLGVLNGQSLEYMAVTTIALVVAAVPESLPLVVTVSLALAARRMAVRHAVVRSLAAVETLGSVTVLATDKTGTLTEGSMRVVDAWHPPGVTKADLLRALALCNDAQFDPVSGSTHGDPTETALLAAVMDEGLDVAAVRDGHPRVGEIPFDSGRKRMTTVHRAPDGTLLTVSKGAPEALLEEAHHVDPAAGEEARRQGRAWARGGMRVIAVCAAEGGREGAADHATGVDLDDPPPLRLLGLVALRDPVRSTSRDTVAACQAAGIRVLLVTGDHPETAQAIAEAVGVADQDVVARATPADKHTLVAAHQRDGDVVAMTGDGVNDGPALRRADIGVAMGRRGTEVARQAADLVLADDNLGTVVAAVEEGRRVYANIRRFLVYGLSGGASEVLLMLAGPAVGFALPLLPAQILWLNLLTHTFAGAGLAAQPADRDVLARGPRPPGQGPLADGLGWRTSALALGLTAVAVGALLVAPMGQESAAALLALGTGQLSVAWALRSPAARALASWGRPLLPLIAVAGAMLAAAVTVPLLRELLGTSQVGWPVWAYAAGSGLAVFLLARVVRARRV
jgi:Ca2+-transporting ATPase